MIVTAELLACLPFNHYASGWFGFVVFSYRFQIFVYVFCILFSYS